MNKTTDWKCIAINLADLSGLFHGLLCLGVDGRSENRANIQRFYILKNLERQGEQNLSEISSALGFRKNTLSELLDRMVNDGLIARAADGHDRRKMNFSLTREGRNVCGDFERKTTARLEDFSKGFNREEKREFAQSLASLIALSHKIRLFMEKK